MIIIDQPSAAGWCHMTATTVDELHAFAKQIGMLRSWFQDKPGRPHYDLKFDKRPYRRAIERGATMVTKRSEFIDFCNTHHKKAPE